MGHRVTGKQMVVHRYQNRNVYEEYCDQCNLTIPNNKYPEISLELTSGPWENSTEYLDFCSWSCLIAYASDQISD